MDAFLEPQEEKKGIQPLIFGATLGIVLLPGDLAAHRQPSMEDQMANILEGSYHEGTPEFAQITKDIIISTSETRSNRQMLSGRSRCTSRHDPEQR